MNYGDLKQSISTRLNRPDLLTPIPPSTQAIIPTLVQDRILFLQKKLYSPSEQLDYSITCIPHQGIYNLQTSVYPSLNNVQTIFYVRLLYGSVWRPLTRVDWYTDLLDSDVLQPAFVSLPSYWATYGQTLRLYPQPDNPYPLELTCSTAPPAPVADTDTNFWTDQGQTAVIESVCADICRLVLNDDARATQHEFASQREMHELLTYTQRLRGPARIRPHI